MTEPALGGGGRPRDPVPACCRAAGGRPGGAEELAARLGGPLPDGPSDPAEVVAQLAKLADDGLVALGRSTLLRSWSAAACWPPWPPTGWPPPGTRTPACSCSARPRPRRGRGRRLAHRPARAAVHAQHRLRHRRPDGPSPAWPRPATTCSPPPAGTWSATACSGAADRGRGRGRAARHHRRRPASAWAADACGSSVPMTRAAWTPPFPRLPARSRRSSAPRRATSTPEPSTRCPRFAPPPNEHGAWVHRWDGALRAVGAASPALRHLVAGVEQRRPLATDAHKWLNVSYDSGLVFVAHPEAHLAAFSTRPAT